MNFYILKFKFAFDWYLSNFLTITSLIEELLRRRNYKCVTKKIVFIALVETLKNRWAIRSQSRISIVAYILTFRLVECETSPLIEHFFLLVIKLLVVCFSKLENIIGATLPCCCQDQKQNKRRIQSSETKTSESRERFFLTLYNGRPDDVYNEGGKPRTPWASAMQTRTSQIC